MGNHRTVLVRRSGRTSRCKRYPFLPGQCCNVLAYGRLVSDVNQGTPVCLLFNKCVYEFRPLIFRYWAVFYTTRILNVLNLVSIRKTHPESHRILTSTFTFVTTVEGGTLLLPPSPCEFPIGAPHTTRNGSCFSFTTPAARADCAINGIALPDAMRFCRSPSSKFWRDCHMGRSDTRRTNGE